MTPLAQKGCRCRFCPPDRTEIRIHKADEPTAFFDLLDTDGLAGEDLAEIDLFARVNDTPAAGDVDGLVVEKIVKFRPALIVAGRRDRDWRLSGTTLGYRPRRLRTRSVSGRQ